jgi:hypothetical protein
VLIFKKDIGGELTVLADFYPKYETLVIFDAWRKKPRNSATADTNEGTPSANVRNAEPSASYDSLSPSSGEKSSEKTLRTTPPPSSLDLPARSPGRLASLPALTHLPAPSPARLATAYRRLTPHSSLLTRPTSPLPGPTRNRLSAAPSSLLPPHLTPQPAPHCQQVKVLSLRRAVPAAKQTAW